MEPFWEVKFDLDYITTKKTVSKNRIETNISSYLLTTLGKTASINCDNKNLNRGHFPLKQTIVIIQSFIQSFNFHLLKFIWKFNKSLTLCQVGCSPNCL